MLKNKKGFTLIELLIVVGIMAILAVIIFTTLDPLRRFRDSRDSMRWQQASELLNAIKLDQLDHGGAYIPAIASLNTSTPNLIFMIGTDSSACNTYNANCTTAVNGPNNCVDLSELVNRGYLTNVPISPNGGGVWTSGHTGYTLSKDANNGIFIRACENENSSTEIKLSR